MNMLAIPAVMLASTLFSKSFFIITVLFNAFTVSDDSDFISPDALPPLIS